MTQLVNHHCLTCPYGLATTISRTVRRHSLRRRPSVAVDLPLPRRLEVVRRRRRLVVVACRRVIIVLVTTGVLVTFVLTAAVLAVTPGPDSLLVLRAIVLRGRRAGLATVAGVLTGLAIWVVAAAVGLSALLRAS